MDIDANLNAPRLSEAGNLAAVAEEMGFDGVWVTERDHSPYTLSTQIAAETDDIDHGTGIAVAFPRSPMVTAYTAWDLAELSGGRFILGLGTQVKGHIQRRFDVDWESPGPQLREYVRCLKHIWNAWATEEEVDYHGDFYEIDFCPPDWRPDPIDHPDIPLYIAGVNDFNIQLAGHLCDGLHVHPVHSPEYIDQKVMPALEKGAARADRDPEDVTLTTMILPSLVTRMQNASRPERLSVDRSASMDQPGPTRQSSRSTAGKTSARRSTTSRWKAVGTNWVNTSPMRCSTPSLSRVIGPNSAITSKSDTRTWTG